MVRHDAAALRHHTSACRARCKVHRQTNILNISGSPPTGRLFPRPDRLSQRSGNAAASLPETAARAHEKSPDRSRYPVSPCNQGTAADRGSGTTPSRTHHTNNSFIIFSLGLAHHGPPFRMRCGYLRVRNDSRCSRLYSASRLPSLTASSKYFLAALKSPCNAFSTPMLFLAFGKPATLSR